MGMKRKKIRGGYLFRNFKGEPKAQQERIDNPDRIILPLRQGYGEELEPLVEPGDFVVPGQIIGRNDEALCSPIHASLPGKVTEIREFPIAGTKVRSIVIETDAQSAANPGDGAHLAGSSPQWSGLDVEKIEELIYLSGVSALGRGGIPTRYWSSAIVPPEAEAIVVVGLEDEPLSPSLSVLLPDSRFGDLVDGVKILKKIMPKASAHLVIDQTRKSLVSSLEQVLKDESVLKLHQMKPKYPFSREEVIVSRVLGRKYPYGFEAVNIGVVVLSVQDVLHVYDAVARGRPLIERTIAVGGTGFAEPKHVVVPVGTPIDFLAAGSLKDDRSYRMVRDSLMTGEKIESKEEPILRDSRALYAIPESTFTGKFSFMKGGVHSDSYSNVFISTGKKDLDTNLHGEERACLACSFCAEVCPMELQPNVLHRYVVNEMISETLINFRVFHCIECNLCTYVCPSKIPLSEYMGKAKKSLHEEGFAEAAFADDAQELKGVKG